MKTPPIIPEDLKFPVSLDLFLRYTAGGKYKDDRLKKYRAWLAESEQFNRLMNEGRQQGKRHAREMPRPSLVEVSEIVARHREEGFNEFQFWIFAKVFIGWLAAQPAIRASHAAKKRWSQERRHKSKVPKLKALLDIARSE